MQSGTATKRNVSLFVFLFIFFVWIHAQNASVSTLVLEISALSFVYRSSFHTKSNTDLLRLVSDLELDKFIVLIYVVFIQISLRQVAANGYKQYIKSRPNASSESVKRSKQIDTATLPVHPLFSKCCILFVLI